MVNQRTIQEDPVSAESFEVATKTDTIDGVSVEVPYVFSEEMLSLARMMAYGRDGAGKQITAIRRNQHEARFFEHDPSKVLDATTTGSGSVGPGAGHGLFRTGTTAGSTFQALMREPVHYSSADADYFPFTVSLPEVTGDGFAEIGIVDGSDKNNGYILRRDVNRVTIRQRRGGNTVKTVSDDGGGGFDQFNGDLLTNFKRAGVLESIIWENVNVFVWSQLWLGSGATVLWVYVPDMANVGEAMIPVHAFRHPNQDTQPSTETPNLRLACFGDNGTASEDLLIRSGCWAQGNSAPDVIPFITESNSSTTNPTVASPFVGKFVSAVHHEAIRVIVECDQDGTVLVEYSSDADTVEFADPVAEYDAAEGQQEVLFDKHLEFVRVTFTPTVDATSFKIQTIFIPVNPPPPRGMLGQKMSKGNSVTRSKSALMVRNSNSWEYVPGDNVNGAKVYDGADEFWRIKNKRFADTEEVRYDIPATLANGDIYTGVATDGSATNQQVWNVIRTYFDANGNPSRERIREGIAWDNRTAGW